MISFAREKFVQNMVRIVQYVREEVVVYVSSQLRRRGIVGGVYKPCRIARRTDASRRCLSVALVKPHHAGDAYNSLERTMAL